MNSIQQIIDIEEKLIDVAIKRDSAKDEIEANAYEDQHRELDSKRMAITAVLSPCDDIALEVFRNGAKTTREPKRS